MPQPSPEEASQRRLVAALQRGAPYPHRADRVEHRETHISHVLLAGDFAYKIKKPLDLDFLDFSTLDLRRHYCREEIRLNARLAPEIYLDVVPITGTADDPVIDGKGDPIEFAVRMRRFDEAHLLSRRLSANLLDAATIDRVAERIARFHETEAAVSTGGDAGTPAAVIAPMRENFNQILPRITDPTERERLQQLAGWTEAQFEDLRPLLSERRDQGRIRECHGDMHLGNMVLTGDRVAIFDGIEFSEALRWIDVASEIAFLIMDLDHRGATALAGHALDAWLAGTGDYEALQVLRFYLVYRAMVRAKISAIRAGQMPGSEAADEAWADYHAHVELAKRYAGAGAPSLTITRGVAGTGKSTAAARLIERIGAVRLRSDVERRRLYPHASAEVRYGEPASDAVHARLEQLADTALRAGWPVVVDATFIEQRRREPFLELAGSHGVEFRLLDLRVSARKRDDRIAARAAAGRDPSEADPEIAHRQESALEPLTPEESAVTITVDNDGSQPIVPATGLGHGRGFDPDE